MIKLKLGLIPDDKPMKLTVELPAELHRDLVAYGAILGQEAGQGPIEPRKLVVPMLERFIATDRGFAKARRTAREDEGAIGPWGGLIGTILLIECDNNPAVFGKTDAILPIRIRWLEIPDIHRYIYRKG